MPRIQSDKPLDQRLPGKQVGQKTHITSKGIINQLLRIATMLVGEHRLGLQAEILGPAQPDLDY